MDYISRQEAKALGLKHYFTGQPCLRGHISRMHVDKGCLECRRLATKAYREKNGERVSEQDALRGVVYRAKNKEKIKAKNAKYHIENRDRINAKKAKWRAENAESTKAASKAWREANPERAKSLVLAWHAKNADARRVHAQNRKKRIRAQGTKLSSGIIKKLHELQKGLCACCREPLGEDYHLDHIMPIALGGPHEDSNMQLLRQKCNNEKKAKHPVDFMQSRGLLL